MTDHWSKIASLNLFGSLVCLNAIRRKFIILQNVYVLYVEEWIKIATRIKRKIKETETPLDMKSHNIILQVDKQYCYIVLNGNR